MEKVKKEKSKRKIIVDIATYIVIVASFLLALTGVLLKFSGKTVYLFGSRFDVVLTDSMSEKNPLWKDFLEGHDDQIQAFDVVRSKEIKSQDDLSLYDIVLFENKNIGTDMHRIVGLVKDSSSDFVVEHSSITTINSYTGISLPDVESRIASNAISIKEITLLTYSMEEYEGSHFNFNILNVDYEPTITTEGVEGGYLKTYTITRDSSAPGQLSLAHKTIIDYSKEIIVSCTIKNESKDIVIDKDSMVVEGDNLVGSFNPVYKYEIRGDKAPNSDGVYSIDKIYSKVETRIPKLGYIVRFLSSIWGTILFIGLGFIAIAFDIVMTRLEKQESSIKDSSNATEAKKEENKNE